MIFLLWRCTNIFFFKKVFLGGPKNPIHINHEDKKRWHDIKCSSFLQFIFSILYSSIKDPFRSTSSHAWPETATAHTTFFSSWWACCLYWRKRPHQSPQTKTSTHSLARRAQVGNSVRSTHYIFSLKCSLWNDRVHCCEFKSSEILFIKYI